MITRTMGIGPAPQQGNVDELDELLPTTKGTQREVQFNQQTSNKKCEITMKPP